MSSYQFRADPAADETAPVIFLFHGTGGDENQFFDIADLQHFYMALEQGLPFETQQRFWQIVVIVTEQTSAYSGSQHQCFHLSRSLFTRNRFLSCPILRGNTHFPETM